MIHAGSFSGLAYRFRLIVDGLRRTVPEHQAKDRSSGPMVGLIWSDLGRRMARFERLLARIEAGIPDRVRPSRAGRAAASREVDTDAGMDAATAAPVARALRLPTRTGWLMLMMPWVVAPYGSQLRYWLMEPEAEALVRSSRQLRRLLRPLLRSLSTDPLPACLLEPEAEADAKPAAAAAGDAGTQADADTQADAEIPGDTETQADAETPDDAETPGDAETLGDAAAPARTGRVVRRGVAVAARRAIDVAEPALPCDAQAVQTPSAPASACGFETAPAEPPAPDWWSVRDARRRAALAIARGAAWRT